MSLLSLQNIQVSFGAEHVLLGISGEINVGDRIGLVGRNGAGKTTLLHVLCGELPPSAGGRHLAAGTTVALVEQIPAEPDSTSTVYNEALSGLSALLTMEHELHSAGEALSRGETGAADAYAALEQRFEAAGGYVYHSRLAQVLTGLGFALPDWHQAVSELSGGQRTRLALAKALLSQPDLLVLDEPTNHIDLDAMTWLDDFLSRWQGTLIVTSHDRYFLDRVANRVWFIDNGRVRAFRGNYSSFEDQLAADIERQQKEADAQARFIAKEEAFIRRYRAGQRAREAKGRQTRLNRVQRLQSPTSQKTTSFAFAAQRSGDLVAATHDLSVGYDDNALLRVGKLEIVRGDRIALIGPNGSGKTTLLKTLAGQLPTVVGRYRHGANVRVSHYWQEAENLEPSRTVLEEVRWGQKMEVQTARNLLGAFLFSGGDVEKPVSALSGGERSRLALAKLVLEKANLLLLDEPTNHLDIPSRESLEEALVPYEGSIVFVSHDRQLIAALATSLWVVEDGSVRVFDGSYSEYLESQASAEVEARKEPVAQRGATASSTDNGRNARREKDLLEKLEAEIATRELEIAALGEQINASSSEGDIEALGKLGIRFEELQAGLETLMDEWLERHESVIGS